jgi:hypothetical protein
VSFTVHKDVMVAMRDGVELATDLWVPDTTPAPTLLVRLPYSKDLPALLGYGLVPNLFALVEAGYAVAYQDCRGTFRSAGEFTPMLNEPDDGADTVRSRTWRRCRRAASRYWRRCGPGGPTCSPTPAATSSGRTCPCSTGPGR